MLNCKLTARIRLKLKKKNSPLANEHRHREVEGGGENCSCLSDHRFNVEAFLAFKAGDTNALEKRGWRIYQQIVKQKDSTSKWRRSKVHCFQNSIILLNYWPAGGIALRTRFDNRSDWKMQQFSLYWLKSMETNILRKNCLKVS